MIDLDFSRLKSLNATSIEKSLCQNLSSIASRYELSVTLSSSSPNDALNVLVEALYNKYGRVAILIDEYDHAILSTLHSPQLNEVLKIIQSFFVTVKSLGEYVHFLFITGVSEFAKAGLFSGMNNPKNLSMNLEYACVCGYTEEEVDRYFVPYLEKMAKQKNTTVNDLRAELKKLYNGYCFSENAPTVYNPFSFINTLDSCKTGNFWFDSGAPSFLIEILKKEYAKGNTSIFHVEEFHMSEMEPKCFDVSAIPLPSLMQQTGYLTIKSFSKGLYTLGFPNLEVQAALQRYMMDILLNLGLNEISNFSTELLGALTEENMEKLISLLKTLCSHVPSKLHISKEKFYHALLILCAANIALQGGVKSADDVVAFFLVRVESAALLYTVE